MAGLGPPVVVDAPPPTPPLQNLVVSGSVITEASDRWSLGFSFCPETCTQVHVWDPSCPPVTAAPPQLPGKGVLKSPGELIPAQVVYTPFILETAVSCCVRGFQTAGYEDRARMQLEAGTPKGLENEFWTGSKNPANRHLADPSAPNFVALADAATPAKGLAALVQAISSCASGGRGMIHATPFLATIWSELADALEVEGPRLVTKVGRHIVVPGTGYPGTSPTGVDESGSGFVWAYATGVVQVRLGAVEVFPDNFAEAFDRRANTVTYRAERVAAAVWNNCCLFALRLSL